MIDTSLLFTIIGRQSIINDAIIDEWCKVANVLRHAFVPKDELLMRMFIFLRSEEE